MNIEDHIPQGESEHQEFVTSLHSAIEEGDLDTASSLLTTSMIDFFSDYKEDPVLFGLLKLANHVRVEPREGNNVFFDTRRRCMHVPHRVAHHIESMHDLACLLLIERARIIVNRSAHAYLPEDMDLANVSHRSVFDIALQCWSIALSRCYCSSVLPEKLYAPYSDVFHNLMHGLDVDGLSSALATKFKNIANTYKELYNMGGQEQYHFMLNRVASGATETMSFSQVLPAFWEDLKKFAPTNSELEQIIDAMLVQNQGDDEDKKIEKNVAEMKSCSKSNAMSHPVPVVDLDVETDIDSYIAHFMRHSSIPKYSNRFFHGDRLHGAHSTVAVTSKIRSVFENMNHSVMLEAERNEEEAYYGSPVIPQHPTTHDLCQYMQGYLPQLWETPMHSGENVADTVYHIYMDISGSMFSWFPVVRAVIASLGNYTLPDRVFGFSTVVEPIDLGSSFLMTTGGTDINTAVQHAKANHATHIIMITDLEDYRDVDDTDGIEHLIVVATDSRRHGIEDSVFKTHSPSTKIDLVNVKLAEVTSRPMQGRSTFTNPVSDSAGIEPDTNQNINQDRNLDV